MYIRHSSAQDTSTQFQPELTKFSGTFKALVLES